MFAKKSESLLLSISAITAITMLFVPLSLYVVIPWVLLLIASAFLFYFFRDPERVAPDEDGIVVSPAEGKIIDVVSLPDESRQIQIELSVWDVHVNRAPVDCKITKITREKGAHWPVWYNRYYAKRNARQHYDIETTDGNKFRVTQIAGIFAWRCVSYVSEGAQLSQNDKFGIIRFGSAAYVTFPKDSPYEITITKGEKIRAGESIIARRK
ncbi:MAG: phosphatidylserine decarboxylase [Asgard group archaeon]|nr:phosphatidylserine decarboxylase [Asgard group archaeon]